jgi:hypothetical protein
MEPKEQTGESASEELQPKDAQDAATATPEQPFVKVTAAQKEAQPEPGAPDISTAESIQPEPDLPPERQRRSRVRRGLYGFGVLLIFFLLGAGLVALLLYGPAQQELDQANKQLRDADGRISELQDQVAALDPLPAQLDEANAQLKDAEKRLSELQLQVTALEPLPDQLDNASQHAAVLGVLADVNAARLALTGGDTASARLYLSATPERLSRLAETLGKEHDAVANAMQKRLELIVKEISRERKLAQTDLDALANQLMQLEMTFLEVP